MRDQEKLREAGRQAERGPEDQGARKPKFIQTKGRWGRGENRKLGPGPENSGFGVGGSGRESYLCGLEIGSSFMFFRHQE